MPQRKKEREDSEESENECSGRLWGRGVEGRMGTISAEEIDGSR